MSGGNTSMTPVLLLLMLLLEPPEPENPFFIKTVSQGMRDHRGIGAALYACLAVQLRKSSQGPADALCSFFMLASALVAMIFEDWAHMLGAGIFFAFATLFTVQRSAWILAPAAALFAAFFVPLQLVGWAEAAFLGVAIYLVQ